MKKYKYNILSSKAPQMPKRLPGFIKLVTSKVPKVMKEAAAMAVFAPAAAQMSNVTFQYCDNTMRELVFMTGTIAPSSSGKKFVSNMIETIIRSMRQHDVESYKKLEEWTIEYRKKAANKDKPEKPQAAILVPAPDITNAALINLLVEAEREGNKSIYTNIPELEMLNQTCGGHSKVTQVIRCNFDTDHYGAVRATADGVTANPLLRWKFNISCVESVARKFFKDSMDDGTFGRFDFAYVNIDPNNQNGFPRQGDYDQEYYDKLDEYLMRLKSATGIIKVKEANRLNEKLSEDMAEIAALSGYKCFKSISNRALNISWQRGCLLYVAEGCVWTKEIADFIEYSLYYDLWSKFAVFGSLLDKVNAAETSGAGHYGPKNMLSQLSHSFTKEDFIEMRKKNNMPDEATDQLRNWINREYIVYDAATQLYTKTSKYYKKHPESTTNQSK